MRALFNRELKKITVQSDLIRSQFKEKLLTYVLAGFGFVAGLAWNDFAKSAIEYLFPQQENNIRAKLIYALLVTLILVMAGISLDKLIKKKETAG